MINSFYIDGVDCRKYGIYPTQRNVYDGAKQNVTLSRPFARSNIIRNAWQTYEPVEIGYTFFTRPELRKKSQSIKDWLLYSWEGDWRRLSDTYDPYHYRKVADVSDISFDNTNDYGQGEIIFTCEAFRYLKSAENPVPISAHTPIFNPTKYPSYPKITIFGSGSPQNPEISINGVRIDIATQYKDVIVDCEDLSIKDENGNSLTMVSTPSGNLEKLYFPPGEIMINCNFSMMIERRWREI